MRRFAVLMNFISRLISETWIALRQKMKDTGSACLFEMPRKASMCLLITPFLIVQACASQYGNRSGAISSNGMGCSLTEVDKNDNATLSVPAFDYTPTTPSTARALSNRGCYGAAAEAGEDYLIRGVIEDERNHSNVIFHVGQNLAMSGDERAAALVVATAKRTGQMAGSSFDWNAYVTGTWAYLRRNRDLLQRSFETLKSQPGEGNQINAKVLGGLLHCYGQPYSLAYSERCQSGWESENR
jgi:hypothetical protein